MLSGDEGGFWTGSEGEGRLEEFRGRSALYHCVSRVVNRDFVLKREEKEEFARLMRVFEEFRDVEIKGLTV